MKILDLDYLNLAYPSSDIQGGSISFASASSSSFASSGVSTSKFEAIAVGNFSATTVVEIKSLSLSKGKQSFDFSSASVTARARG